MLKVIFTIKFNYFRDKMKEGWIGVVPKNSTVKWSSIVCISVVNLLLLLSTIAIGTYISVDVNHVCIRFISKYLNLINFLNVASGPQIFFLETICY